MSYILRSSSFINATEHQLEVKDFRSAPAKLDEHHFFYNADTLASLTVNWTNPDLSKGRLAQLGGVQGIARALRTDLRRGIFQDELKAGFARRNEAFGQNVFKKRKPRNFFLLVLDELRDPVLLLLVATGIFSTVMGFVQNIEEAAYTEGLAILCTVALVSLVAAGSNFNKERQFRSLDKQKDVKTVIVVRAGEEVQRLNTEVVVGDLVALSTGVSIPCDGVLISGTAELLCEESALTGESCGVHKSRDLPFLFAGTQVVDGEGLMLATSVGYRTNWGSLMAGLAAKRSRTPLEIKLSKLVKIIGIIGVVLATIMFVFNATYWIIVNHPDKTYIKNLKDLLEYLLTSLTLVVVAIPEGLPLAVTITLAYSMKKMYKDNNFVRVLAACETMGNATTICSDKTGTLTQNLMTVVKAWPAVFTNETENTSPRFSDESDLADDYKNALLEGIALNSKVFRVERSKWKDESKPEFSGGNKTDCAVFSWGIHLGLNDKAVRAKFPIERAFPFNSANKRSHILIKRYANYRVYLKGAAEKVIAEVCDSIMHPDGTRPLMTGEIRAEINSTIDAMVSKGLRCIALAFRDYPLSALSSEAENEPCKDPTLKSFSLLAIVAIKDPLREDVLESVQRCQESGIVVRMVTGDHPLTAEFIAAECGIRPVEREDLLIMTGDEFRAMSADALAETLPRLRVLARSTPQDKERVVRWFMTNNETVAVTGDGANDALALKEADVGLSMGIQGTDVAKEASDIIILDDSFASIVETVKWGRSVYDNIRKFVQFQVTINAVALFLSLVGSFINYDAIPNFPLPFTPVQLLWMNIIMDTGAALAFSTEYPTPTLLKRKPYRKDCWLISFTMWKHIIGQAIMQGGILLLLILPKSNPIGFAVFRVPVDSGVDRYLVLKTCIFNTFVWFQMFNSFNARRINDELNVFQRIFSNWLFPVIFLVEICLQIVIVTFFKKVASVTPLNAVQWLVCIGLGAIGLPLGFLLRLIPFKRNYGFVQSDGDLTLAKTNSENLSRRSITTKTV